MAGVSPWAPGVTRVTPWLTARVYPIRVAGNSGPLAGETTWEELGLPEEKTTVTHKTRRVGQWDRKLIREAGLANGTVAHQYTVLPQEAEGVGRVALTMVDQKIPEIYGVSDLDTLDDDVFDRLLELIEDVEDNAGTPVGLITTSPDTVV